MENIRRGYGCNARATRLPDYRNWHPMKYTFVFSSNLLQRTDAWRSDVAPSDCGNEIVIGSEFLHFIGILRQTPLHEISTVSPSIQIACVLAQRTEIGLCIDNRDSRLRLIGAPSFLSSFSGINYSSSILFGRIHSHLTVAGLSKQYRKDSTNNQVVSFIHSRYAHRSYQHKCAANGHGQ